MPKVAIVGASGYAGAELIRLVHSHPDFELRTITAGSLAGSRLAQVHPQFSAQAELADLMFAQTSADALADAELIFLALPHGQSGELITTLPESVKVVDLGADFRLTDAGQWEKYYEGAYAGSFVYGLPELPGRRTQIAASSKVANPGCYATAIELGLAPLICAQLIEVNDIIVVAASGTSGAGRRATANLLGSEVMGAMSAYRIGGTHQHTPEIEQELQGLTSESVAINFTPMLAPMPRGILATISAKANANEQAIRKALIDAYQGESFVRVLPADQLPNTAATLGSNAVHLQVAVDPHTNRVTVVTALDNLIKGAAGQAVQNANLMFGLPEGAGLTAIGIAP
ncbi:MAG: N-acetyl-gamma-glutamyl-phosphate reductase [Actinobacteria bacterium]|nr:N-acetyl-gamma-glutamyl-phosphate reductase [Actinomycetota bacterium]NBY14918.1 N-acetyl-gamma-glutamyl-phosphate reductase [Actinomycetota bacterium]